MPGPLLRVRGLTKTYGSVRALDGADCDVQTGEIHGLLGENGAGKSTLLKILSGLVVPDSGTVTLGGGDAPLGDPRASREAGIRTVHQHFMLVPNFTVEENLALAEVGPGLNPSRLAELAVPAVAVAESLGWDLPLGQRTGDVSVGGRQRIEIAKALSGTARLLILDEPTAVLTPDETNELFDTLRRLRAQGVSIVLIAHKLAEVLAVTDRVTVLRHGKVTGSGETSKLTENELATMMVGEIPVRSVAAPVTTNEKRLRVSRLVVMGDRGEQAVKDVSLEVASGETVGIGGVDGNGQVELAEAVAGVRPHTGTVSAQTPVAYIPQDRQTEGLALDLSVEENLCLGRVPRSVLTGGFLDQAKIRSRAKSLCQQFDVRMASVRQPVRHLSGGNQQKLLVARELDKNPALVVAVNPTRGLDVAAATFVHGQLRQAATNGAAVLVVSTDADELAELCDRTLWLSHGRLVGSLGGRPE